MCCLRARLLPLLPPLTCEWALLLPPLLPLLYALAPPQLHMPSHALCRQVPALMVGCCFAVGLEGAVARAAVLVATLPVSAGASCSWAGLTTAQGVHLAGGPCGLWLGG